MSSPPTDHRHAWLLEVLERLRPTSLLDVACGEGWLLFHARTRGLRARGVDLREARIHALRLDGFDADVGDATALPVADRSFDVVVVRNALHHMESPRAAAAEALRAAARAVVIAEPWFDPAVASQRLAREVDEWVKVHERRAGRVHHPYPDVEELIALLPAGAAVDVETTQRRVDLPKPAAEWFEEIDDLLAALPPDDPAHAERRALAARIDEEGATREGATLLTLTRR